MYVIHMRAYFIHLIILSYTLYYVVIVLGELLGEPLLLVRHYPLILPKGLYPVPPT
jgi:hypothetical protein